MALTQYYVDPFIAGNSGTGTLLDPFGDLQYALNTITRNATDGDQINIKAGTAEILAASLTLATYGTPTASTVLILRGYTAAANDGGRAEINCNGVTMFALAYSYVILADMTCHTFGNNSGISFSNGGVLFRCTVHRGASSPSSKSLILGVFYILDCHIYNPGATGNCITPGNGLPGLISGCYISTGTDSSAYGIQHSGAAIIPAIINNLITCDDAGSTGMLINGIETVIIGNTVYNSTAGTTSGITVSTTAATRTTAIVMNNVVMGWSGVGGVGIRSGFDIRIVGYNALYNNNTPYSIADQKFLDLTSADATLLASPFTNAAGGNFSVSTALKALGWPSSFLGSATNTYVDIGAAQRQEAVGGGMLAANKRGNKQA